MNEKLIAQREYARRWREANREKCREYYRQFRLRHLLEHREKQREVQRKYYLRHVEKVKARCGEYYKKHGYIINEKKRAKEQQLKKEVLTLYGGGGCACVICGEIRLDCLSLDHINNDGYSERKKTGNGACLYYFLKKSNFPIGYQTLCMNCQFVKRGEKFREKPRLGQ